MSTAGHQTRINYDWEDSFRTAPSSASLKTFGGNATLDTLEGTHQAIKVFNPNDRESTQIIEQLFNGSWSVSFELTNPWWAEAVLSEPTTSGSSAPYTHTYDGSVPNTMEIYVSNEKTGDERTLRGCVATSATISVDVGGTVNVTLSGAYAADENATPGTLKTQTTLDERVLTFSEAQLSVDGSTKGRIQGATVNIENNIDMIAELGDNRPVDYSPKARAPSIDYTDIVEDSSELERFYGGSTTLQDQVTNTVDIDLVFDNGGTGSSTNKLTISLTGAFPDSYSLTGIGDSDSDLQGELSEMVNGVTAVAENDVETAP